MDSAQHPEQDDLATPGVAQKSLAGLIATVQSAVTLILVVIIILGSISMNREALQSQVAMIDNALNQLVTRVLNEQKSIAFWDAAVTNFSLRKLDLKWADDEYGAYLSETYGHSASYVLDDQDRPIYAYAHGGRQPTTMMDHHRRHILPLLDEIRGRKNRSIRRRDMEFSVLQAAPSGFSGSRNVRWAANLLDVDGHPTVVSAMTIVPNVDQSIARPVPHVLVSFVAVDAAQIRRIGRMLLIPDLFLTERGIDLSGVASEPLVTDDGKPSAFLVWSSPNAGRFMVASVLPIVLVAAIAAALTTRTLLRRLLNASRTLSEREAHARYLSLHDMLSRLPNRRSFQTSLDKALEDSRADDRINVVAYIDIDRFKDINDTLGHGMGDALIFQVGARLRSVLPEEDHVARIGGDEFAVLRRTTDRAEAESLGAFLLSAFEAPLDVSGQQIRIQISVGIALSPDHGTEADIVLRNADIALFHTKEVGRNRCIIFSPDMAEVVQDRYAIEADLRDAITRDEIFMMYQPIIDAPSQQIMGVEALVRWKHPQRGIVSPAQFIPIAEGAGLMPELGMTIFRKVFKDAARWPSLQISVNLSPAQMLDVNFIGMLQTLSRNHAITPARIVFEITEGVLLEASSQTHEILAHIRQLGFKIALDDFGTGFSSLSYLRQFKFDKLKIDRSFVRDIRQADEAMCIVQAIVALATGLGMQIVAEGVETETEAELMTRAGCHELQGFYFSRPIEPAVIDAFFCEFVPADRTARPA